MNGSCSEIRELLPEYALGTLTGSAALEVEEHTRRCVACRSRLAELTGVADALLRARTGAGAVVVVHRRGRRRDRRRRERAAPPPAAPAARPSSPRPRPSLAARRGWGARRPGDGPRPARPRRRRRASWREEPMIGAGGRYAGHVLLYRGDPTMAVVSVDYGTLPPGDYAVATTGGSTDATVGHVAVDARGRGAGAGHSTAAVSRVSASSTRPATCSARPASTGRRSTRNPPPAAPRSTRVGPTSTRSRRTPCARC